MTTQTRPARASRRVDSTHMQVFRRADRAIVEWRTETRPIAYDDALAVMEMRAGAIRRSEASELVWLLEHPPIYTAGTSAGADLPQVPFPIHRSGRGGQVTYHGPGQRVAYVLLDLQERQPDVRAFVAALEQWIIDTLTSFGITGERRDDRVGVWVARPDKAPGFGEVAAEDKIAAIGIRVRRWVSFHGISLNVEPDLSHYGAITPCGISDDHLGVTSLADLGRSTTTSQIDEALRRAFVPIFGPATIASDAEPPSR